MRSSDGLRDLERAALGAALAGTIGAVLLVARNGLAPIQRPLTFGIVFWKWFALAYLAFGGPLLLAAFALARVPRLRAFARGLPLLLAAAFLATALSQRKALFALLALDGPDRFRWLLPAGFLLAAAALVVVCWPWPRPVLARATSLLALAAVAGALAPSAGTSAPRAVASGPARRLTPRLLVVGIDGADWRYLDPLIARGDLPNLAAFKQRAAWGPLTTAQPTLSPVVWTTIVTGVPPPRHGVSDFLVERLEGVSGALPRLAPVARLGSESLVDWLRRSDRVHLGPVGSDVRRVPAFWSIATARGRSVVLVNWWATWPAEPLLGEMVSERAYHERLVYRERTPPTHGLTWPEDLYARLGPLSVTPDGLPIERMRDFLPDVGPEEFAAMSGRTAPPGVLHELNYYVASFDTDRRVATALVARNPDADAFVLFRIVDKMCHAALQYSELVDDHLGATPEQQRRFSRLVSQAYREADAALGDVMKAFGDGNVIVLSDHGFSLERKPHPRYFHEQAPDGVMLAAGPSFRLGRVEGLDVLDMMPLLLRLGGYPLADDMPGKLPRAALTPAFLSALPEKRVASYGTQAALQLTAGGSAADAEMVERLRALGYIRY